MFNKAQLTENADIRDFIVEKLVANGYVERKSSTCYDRALAMDKELLLQFLEETQPDEIKSFRKIYKDDADETLVNFINRAITNSKSDGLLKCLKKGIDLENNIHINLMYQIPSTQKNPLLNKQYAANKLSIMKEVCCSDKERIDLVIFLNGLAIVSFELKCVPSGQTYKNAIAQYQQQRDPKNRLFMFKAGCLVNFALDNNEVHMCTKLNGEKSKFLPFNLGCGEGIDAGYGNPIPKNGDLATHYMWDKILLKDNLLELIGKFILVDVAKKKDPITGKDLKSNEEFIVFPRYHQLDAVQKVLADVKNNHTSRNYLIQHSAGSGKTYTISWLAYRLSEVHDYDDKSIFDSVIIVTDRVVVDRQLQQSILSFTPDVAYVKMMDDDCTSEDLAIALTGKTKIIGSTIQKFRYIVDKVKSLKDRNFAVIIDEAHSSTAGKNMLAAQKALGSDDNGIVSFDNIENELEKTGKVPNMSVFAFTATPKPKTLDLFGTIGKDGRKKAFHLYSMKQAIEEGYILDVLSHYIEYSTFYKINKTILDDPEFKNKKAKKQIASIVALSDENIEGRTGIIIEHFRNVVMQEQGPFAKAMIVTSSRAEAVKYKQAFDKYLMTHDYNDIQTLVAFSGKVKLPNDQIEYTESGMNGIREDQLPSKFENTDYKILLVADKYQTGFDQPKLCAMYVMKKLRGVAAVQTLSRLNRTCSAFRKKEVFVLDFVNTQEEMVKEFAPFYTVTELENSTDPSKIYDLLYKVEGFYLIDDYDVDKVNEALDNYSTKTKKQKDRAKGVINNICSAISRKWKSNLDNNQRKDYKVLVSGFVRTYEFLMQITKLDDVELHRWYRLLSYVEKYLRIDNTDTSFDLTKMLNVTDFEQKFEKEVKKTLIISDPNVKLPSSVKGATKEDEKKHLSEIINDLNRRNGTSFNIEAALKSILAIIPLMESDSDLAKKAMTNNFEDFLLSFLKQSNKYLSQFWEENQALFGQIMSDENLKKQIFGSFAESIYNNFRK